MKIELACIACGRNRFSLAQALNDDAVIHCEDCGREIGTLRDLKDKVARAVLNRRA